MIIIRDNNNHIQINTFTVSKFFNLKKKKTLKNSLWCGCFPEYFKIDIINLMVNRHRSSSQSIFPNHILFHFYRTLFFITILPCLSFTWVSLESYIKWNEVVLDRKPYHPMSLEQIYIYSSKTLRCFSRKYL